MIPQPGATGQDSHQQVLRQAGCPTEPTDRRCRVPRPLGNATTEGGRWRGRSEPLGSLPPRELRRSPAGEPLDIKVSAWLEVSFTVPYLTDALGSPTDAGATIATRALGLRAGG
jgi:hypothetical protein